MTNRADLEYGKKNIGVRLLTRHSKCFTAIHLLFVRGPGALLMLRKRETGAVGCRVTWGKWGFWVAAVGWKCLLLYNGGDLWGLRPENNGLV